MCTMCVPETVISGTQAVDRGQRTVENEPRTVIRGQITVVRCPQAGISKQCPQAVPEPEKKLRPVVVTSRSRRLSGKVEWMLRRETVEVVAGVDVFIERWTVSA